MLGSLTAALVDDIEADQQVRVYFFDVVMDAFGAVARVHEIQGRTDAVCGIKRINDLRRHHADHGDDVAFLDASGAEGGGGLFDVHDQVCIGEFPTVVFKGWLSQTVLVLLADIVERRAFRNGLIDVLLAVILQPGACL